jgi:CDP-diglyceride synthetase
VYASTIAIVVAVLLPAALNPALFAIVAAIAAYRCMLEIAWIHGAHPTVAAQGALATAAGLAAWLGARQGAGGTSTLMASSIVLIAFAAPVYLRALKGPVRGASVWILAASLPLLAAAHLSHLVHRSDGFLWVFLLYATVEVQDSMAFLFGRLFGRRALLPRLSPHKTLEGALAGAAFGVGTGTAIALGLLAQPPGAALALAALLVAAGFGGDVLTSALKRAAGVKDFPPVHALHGGLMDIYDSTLAAVVPLSAAVWLLEAAG